MQKTRDRKMTTPKRRIWWVKTKKDAGSFAVIKRLTMNDQGLTIEEIKIRDLGNGAE